MWLIFASHRKTWESELKVPSLTVTVGRRPHGEQFVVTRRLEAVESQWHSTTSSDYGQKNPTGDALKRLPVRGQETGGWHDLVGNALKGNLGNWNLEYLLSTNCQHQTSDRFPVRMQPNLKGLPCHMSINSSFPLIGSCFICSPQVDESLTQDPPTLHCQQLFCSTSPEVAEYCWLFMVSCCQDAAACFLCGCPLKVLHCPPPEKNKWQKVTIKVLLLGNTLQT